MKKGLIALAVVVVVFTAGWMLSTNQNSTKPGASEMVPSRTVLNLKNSGVTTVGPAIYDRTDLTELDLSGNNLKTLPSQIGNLTNLQVLRLDHNQLEGSLVAEVRKMPLVELDVSYNNMTGMPAEIGQLNRLQTLNYSYNKLTGLPNELSHLKGTLKVLDLTGNPLGSDTIAKLRTELPETTIRF
jgi:Leucine-rich repeat (LRR) protein